jgi:hypothetical protein
MVALNKLQFIKIENLLSKEEVDLITEYCNIKHRENFTSYDFDQNNNGDTYFYKDPVMQSLAKAKKKIFEEKTGIKLFETYTFWRCYTYNAILTKHRDRPSCEISATICINSDGTQWPIYMGGQAIDLNPGDGIIYNGCHVEHWRDAFKGDFQHQVFLHYVDANGEYKDYKGDDEDVRKRKGI